PETAPEEGVDYKPPDINTFPEGPLRTAEESHRKGFTAKLKKRIMAFALYHFVNKHLKGSEKLVAKTCDTFRDLREEQPRKKTDLQRYQELHYEERVKPEFNEFWKGGGKELVKEKNRLAEMNTFSKGKFDSEDPKFIEALRALNASIYAEELQKYAKRGEWKGTAEDYFDAWMRSKAVLTALCDAIAKIFGTQVTMFLTGPRHDGMIRTSSMTSMVPDSQTSMAFQDFLPEKYAEIHTYCNQYARHVFSEEECKKRVFTPDESVVVDEQQVGWERFATSDDHAFTPAAAPIVRPDLAVSAGSDDLPVSPDPDPLVPCPSLTPSLAPTQPAISSRTSTRVQPTQLCLSAFPKRGTK
ncbi:hypothetical protein MPER_12857, partial [Moniliophthora perniciosa FA553]